MATENLRVVKFGGTSVGNLDRISHVANMVKNMTHESKVVVVVSAMAGETDRLINLAKSVSENPSERDLDQLLATGELVSASLVSIALNKIGVKAVSLASHQVKIVTNSEFTSAKIIDISADKLIELLNEGIVPVVAGFQGVDSEGNITTLGRGGSDTTAVALACALKERFPDIVCEIYTDVDGVYSVDPRVVANGKKLPYVSYEEMLELASSGAKVLHPRSVALASKYNLPVLVKSSFVEAAGTLVSKNGMEDMPVIGISVDRDQCLLSICLDSYDKVLAIFEQLKSVVIDVISLVKLSDRFSVGLTVSRSLKTEALTALGSMMVVPETETNCAKITLVGIGMITQSGVAKRALQRLHSAGVAVLAVSTSEVKISVVINLEDVEKACVELAEEFDLLT